MSRRACTHVVDRGSAFSGLHASKLLSHAALLAGVSALALLVHAMPAHARPLNGGATASATVIAAASAITSAQQAATATAQSMNSLSRAAQAIQAMQALQAAARNQALSAPSGVPNGLVAGGLTPDSGLAGNGVANTVTTWTNAATPTQATSGGQTVVTVQQTAQKAILNWSSFNIGSNTELYINQSAGNSSTGNGWIALNRVSDPSGVPSQILGEIKAEGSVYLLNANGIIFGGSSQINVSSLIASSLNLFSNNLAASNSRFLNGGIGDLDTANFATDSILLTSATPGAGDITIAAGASITLASTGLAVIAAPNVTNNGAITAPSGQAALIAGVGVSYDYNYSSLNPDGPDGSSGHPQGYNDNSTTFLRFANYGELTDANGADVTPVGALINNGLIYTPRGNITLLGGAVQQNGVAVATTSVKQPGSIVVQSLYEVGVRQAYIPATTPPVLDPADEYDATFYTGAVSFGPQAVTAVLPDANGVTLASDATSLAPFKTPAGGAGFTTPLPTQGFGLIEIIGQAIDFQGGSLAYAPGQTIAASTAVLVDPRTSAPPVPGSGRILLEDGAVIDVSGIPDVELTMASNLLTVTLGGNELADSPLQQDDALYGATVTVDMRSSGTNAETGESWVGTPLANLSSYGNLRQNSIDQLLVNGGAVYLQSNEFVGASGSTINLMGGYLHYLGGMVQTTELVGANGGLTNIGSANPNVVYVGIAGQFTVDHAHWGVKEIYTDPLIGRGYYEPDYIQGGAAGTLSIGVGGGNGAAANTTVANSGAAILDSTVLAGAVAGAWQVGTGALPSDGTFGFSGIESIEIGDPSALSPSSLAASLEPANFSMASPLLASAGSVYAAANVFSSQTLDDANFKNISLATATTTLSTQPTSITEDVGTSLAVQPGGSITLSSGSVIINGDLTARAGGISIATFMIDNAPNDIVIASSAVLDVSGLFFNEALWSPAAEQGITALVNGGSISLATGVATTAAPLDLTGDITLAAGSLLDLEGGGIVLANGQLKTGGGGAPVGSGGNLTLETYQGAGMPPIPGAVPSRGVLALDGAVDALGFSGGGTLTLQQVAFQIGGDPAITPSYAFYFDPTFWGDRGFGSFNLSSVLQSEVPAGAIVRLTHQNLLPNLAAIASAPTGADPAAYATAGFLTGTLLSPTNLSVTAGLEESQNYYALTPAGSDYAQIDLGAMIVADPGASVSIASYTMTNILGGITAPGGAISLTVKDWATVGFGSGPALGPLYIGPDSVLDVSGTTQINPLPTPVHTASGWVTPVAGQILAGGAITLTDNYSPILVAPGAVFNVSGASGAFQVAQLSTASLHGGVTLINQEVWSDAGAVNIAGASTLLFEGTLIGQPGAPQAEGGTLAITGDSTPYGNAPYVILVQDTAAALAVTGSTFNFATYAPAPGASAPVPPDLLFGVDSLSRTGFSSLRLTNTNSFGVIGFAGTVSLTLGNSFIANGLNYTATSATNLNWLYFSGPTNGASLTVSAPYIAINGSNNTTGIEGSPESDATLTLNATKQLDLSGFLNFENFGQVTFISSGDIRLLPGGYVPSTGSQLPGFLLTGANLTFEAADIYPATDTAFVIMATPGYSSSPLTTVTFGYPSGVAPSNVTPLSAAGTLLVDAGAIVQDGEIQAPFGSIILGVTGNSLGASNYYINLVGIPGVDTTSVTLGAGSVTSVSANETTIPFGSTVDQTTWVYNPLANNPTWGNGTVPAAFTAPLTGAPQGVVTLTGDAVALNPGAVVNLNGGGDLQAQEWIPGTGGSRNVLLQYQTSYQNSTSGAQVPTYPDARQIFAILPGYSGPVAPYDAALSQSGMTAGQSVYLAGGNGLAAGYYLLLPAQYATLPGAYRVALDSSSPGVLSNSTITLADGTMVMQGSFANGIGNTLSSTTELFYVQSAATWEKYSQYALTSADSFFPTYAATNGLAAPNIAADAGRLAVAATTGLVLSGAIQGAAAAGGTGAQVDISSQYIEIVDSGSGSTTIAGQTYLEVGAQQLDALGVSSLLIGGVRSQTSAGTAITPTANGVMVANDSNAPLIAPEIMLVAAPQFSTSNANSTITLDSEGDSVQVATPVAGTGLVTINPGSVIEAEGALGGVESSTIILGGAQSLPTLPTSLLVSAIEESTYGYTPPATLLANYYAALDADLGTVVRVSNGAPVTVQLPSAAQISPGAIAVTDNVNAANPVYTVNLPSLSGANGGAAAVIQTGATVTGGNSLTLVSTGDVQVQSGALLSGANITARSSSISFLGVGAVDPQTGLEIDAATLAELESAKSVNLQSYGGVAFYGDVTLAMIDANSVLTLGGDSLSNNGGAVTISAPTLALDNELGGAPPATLTTGSGALSINVGALIFGAGAKSLTGFGSVSVAASQGVVAQGTGGMNFGALPLKLQTPILIADTSSTQTLTTAGALSVTPVAGSALTSTALGGAITLQGGSVTVAVPVQALAGNISLEASSGNVEVTGTGSLIAHGVAETFKDVAEYASAGTITLSANQGVVLVDSGSVVDFAGATDSKGNPLGGNGGALSITTTNSTNAIPVTLSGTVLGATAAGYTGSSFSLNTDGAAALDSLASILTTAGVTDGISVESGQGDLSLSKTLTASSVYLIADGGTVTINGTVNASGPAGGAIALFGAKGVDVEGSLLARACASGVACADQQLNAGQLGGTVEIGVSGAPNSVTTTDTYGQYNSTYGYENVAAANSGVITLGPNAVIDVSGGSAGGKSGGAVLLRAPLLEDGSVNVVVNMANPATQIVGSRSVTLEAYAVWSTADGTTGPQHFDGVIDPAGWYDANGNLLSGTFADAAGDTILNYTAGSLTAAQLAPYLTNDFFTPNAANTDPTRTAHETFYGYVNGDSAAAAPGTLMGFVETPGFAGVANSSFIANFSEVPGVELDNPTSAGVNNGSIQVLTNWNLGALNANVAPLYRTNGAGAAPILTLRAGGNLAVNASLTDGFVQVGDTIYSVAPVPIGYDTYAEELTTYNGVSSNYNLTAFSGLTYLTPDLLAANNLTLSALTLQPPYSATTLGDPSATTYDQYYSNWRIYELRYNNFFRRLTSYALISSYSSAGLTPQTTTTANGADDSTVNAANALTTDQNTLATDSNFTTMAGYATYISDYNTYSSDYRTWSNDVVNSGLTVATLIQPPLPPPELSTPFVQVVNFPSFVVANSPNVMPTAANQAAISGMALNDEAVSSSYRLVAGANLNSADPLALDAATGGSVSLDGHSLVQPNSANAYYIAVPTIVRTGAGSIDVAAAGDFDLLDPLAPGVVYTAGTVAQAPTAATAVALGAGAYYQSGSYSNYTGVSTLLTPAVNPTGGGNITLTVGGGIFGIENVVDTLATSTSTASGLTSQPGAFVGQFWMPWLLSNPNAPGAWYVNFGSFDQGVMSVGGNVTVTAGGDIHDLAVSLPTTSWLDSANVAHIAGGGDLVVKAGGSIYSGDFYVGQGSGAIAAGGGVASDFTYFPDYSALTTSAFPVATLLAVQYGAIAVDARQSVDIGGVFDPTYLYSSSSGGSPPVASYASASAAPIDLVPYVTSLSAAGGVSVQSTSGALTFNSLLAQGVLSLGDVPYMGGVYTDPYAYVTSLLLPASLNLAALSGGVTVDHGGGLYPSATGALSIIADQSVTLAVPLEAYSEFGTSVSYQPVTFTSVGNVFGGSLGKLDYQVGTGILPTASNPTLLNVWDLTPTQSIDPALVAAEEAAPVDPVRIYSLNGSIVDGAATNASEGNIYELVNANFNVNSLTINIAVGGTVGQISVIPNAPAQIYAGADILDMPFYGENFTASQVTSLVAGRDIRSNIYGDAQPAAIELAGPGSLVVQAGRDLTFAPQPNVPSSSTSNYETGIRTLGNSPDGDANPIYGSPAPANNVSPYATTTYLADFGNPYLPTGGASVSVKFGVGPGVDVQAFIAAYLDPATASGATALSAQEWTAFQALSPAQQQLVVDAAFFDILNTTGLDYNNPSSATYKQYSAGYEAINTLFPASYGYTANALGAANGANQLVTTGMLDLRGSTIQTQQGGDISILGPGGRVLVGSANAQPAVNPASQGVLTLESGNIDIFADQSVLVAQSRIMTEQGGGIVMWSSNGNLDAGEGAKTSVSAPPPLYKCDIDWICAADIKGQVSGAGIATLQSLPGVPVGNANLMAPRGTVNFGAAGARVSGNLNVAALFVANAFNVQVGGAAIGVAAPPPDVGALTTGNNQAGASAQQATAPTQSQNNDRPSIIMVEILGFGGGGAGDESQQPEEPQRRRNDDRRSYNINSRLQVIGLGALNDDQKRQLTDSEQRRLIGQ